MRARPLTGGGARVLAIDVRAAGRVVRLVLKRHVNPVWIAEEPDMAAREARVLEWLEVARVAAPRLVAVDADGHESTTPALLMTRVPGRSRFRALERGSRLERLADVLVEIHALRPPPSAGIGMFARYSPDATPPEWSPHAGAWQAAIDGASLLPAHDATFIHRDYHPENVLWRGESISGVIDWVNGCIGPRAIDIAHFRGNLFRSAGRRTADAWVEACLRAGVVNDYDRTWDLVVAVDFLPAESETDGVRRAIDRFMLAALGSRPGPSDGNAGRGGRARYRPRR